MPNATLKRRAASSVSITPACYRRILFPADAKSAQIHLEVAPAFLGSQIGMHGLYR